MRVEEMMSKNLFCCTPTDGIQQAAKLMKDNDVGAIPVVKDCNERKLLGIITDRDICVKVVAMGKSLGTTKVSEVMTNKPATCGPEESIEACEATMGRNQVRRIPVVDTNGVCIGMVSQADIALHDTAEQTYKTVAAVSRHHAQPHGQVAAARA